MPGDEFRNYQVTLDYEKPLETSADPLLCHAPLPLEAEFWPLGFPLRIRTNSEAILRAAEASWGHWRKRFDQPALVIHAGVHGSEGGATPEMPVFRSQGNLISIVASRMDTGVCDLANGFGYCWVTPATAADAGYFRYGFLEAIAYLLIQARHLAPVHGACVARNGRGMLFCGDTCAGKSSLAYGCARRGWTYVSDDASHVVRDRDDAIVIGSPHSIRLRVDAPALFPELSSFMARKRITGKVGLEIRTADLDGIRTADESAIHHILFLDRQPDSPPSLRPMTASEALAEFTKVNNYGTSQLHAEWEQCFKRLLSSSRISRFTYSTLDPAIDRLEQLIDNGE